MHGPISVFALEETRSFGESVAAAAGLTLRPHHDRTFEDGEHTTRPLSSVRGHDVYVVQSLAGDAERSVNDKLCRLLFLLATLRDAAAARVTAVTPYLCYARKDRQTKPRDAVTSRYVASLFEAVGVDRVVVMDVHNRAAYQNAFRCQTEHLEAKGLFAARLATALRGQPIAVVSPDAGGVKRAQDLRLVLSDVWGQEVPSAYMEKQRSDGTVRGELLVGELEGRVAILYDDLISSGTTLIRAARACRERGARGVVAAATHGVFAEQANQLLDDPALDRVLVTNTIMPLRLHSRAVREKVDVVDAAPLVGEAIRRLHAESSITDLIHDGTQR